jgi:hypothetical protein
VFCVALLCAALSAATAKAGTLAIGFEQPDYAVGNIGGQQNWSKTGAYDAAVSSAAGVGGSAQSLRISNGVTSGSFGDQTFTPHLATPAGESSIPGALDWFQASWFFKSVTGELQNGLFISVSADNGAGARMTWVGMGDNSTDGLNLGFYDWDKTRFDNAQDPWVYQQLAVNLDRTVWHRVDLNVYFKDGSSNDVVTVALDGQTLVTGTTWEDFYRYQQGDGGGGGLSPVNSLLFRAGGTAAPDTLGNGFYIDDVTIASQQTPEPGTVGLLLAGIGAIAALARRRRSIDRTV